jgi:hypothetical protein
MGRIWKTLPLSKYLVSTHLHFYTLFPPNGFLDQRWYMFQNMGPTPAGRSGHAMASIGSMIYLVGGESFAPTKGEDPNVIHVLNTSKIIHCIFSFVFA